MKVNDLLWLAVPCERHCKQVTRGVQPKLAGLKVVIGGGGQERDRALLLQGGCITNAYPVSLRQIDLSVSARRDPTNAGPGERAHELHARYRHGNDLHEGGRAPGPRAVGRESGHIYPVIPRGKIASHCPAVSRPRAAAVEVPDIDHIAGEVRHRRTQRKGAPLGERGAGAVQLHVQGVLQVGGNADLDGSAGLVDVLKGKGSARGLPGNDAHNVHGPHHHDPVVQELEHEGAVSRGDVAG